MNSTAPKERPILFSAPMVCAVLAGTKTQTRRVARLATDNSGALLRACPYGGFGDRLWVRETWGLFEERPDKTVSALMRGLPPEGSGYKPHYRATDRLEMPAGAWRPSIHMFRWASRITLEITGLRVERLKSISPADAIAEGIERRGDYWRSYMDANSGVTYSKPVNSYASLWESINGDGSWDANPWVWVVEFKRAP